MRLSLPTTKYDGIWEAPLLHGHVTGHLHHPCLIGMRRDARHMDLPTAQVQEKQDVIRHEPPERPDLGGEEVGRHEDVEMRADELLPCRGGLTLGGGWKAMALQDVAYRLGTDGVPEVGQGADDPVIASGAIFLGHAHDQGLQL
jgi:hypothetical protein